MQHFKNMVFWKKLVLTGAIPLLIIGILIGTLSYSRARQTAQAAEKNSLSDAVNRIDVSLTVRTRQINSTVQIIANSRSLLELSEGEDSRVLNAGQVRDLCLSLMEPLPEIQSMSVMWGGQLVCSTGDAAFPDGAMLSEMYRHAQAHPGKVIWSDLTVSIFPEQQDEARPVIPVYQGILDENGGTAGLLVLELDPYATGSAILTKQRILTHQTTLLLNGSFRTIYKDASLSDGLLALILEQYNAGKRMFTVELGDKSYYCCAQYNGIVGWVTFSLIAEEHLFPGAQSLRSYIILLVIICVTLACVLLMFLSQIITKPLARLNDGMHQVQRSNFETHLPNDRTDEIGKLTDSFNSMVDQIRTLINRVYQEQLAQKNAEIETLQAQINPHFLYNTLDSINWMLIDRGEMDVSAIVVALGKLMQYSMDTSVSLVPLREEYRNARDYLIVQRNRLEDQLDYALELEAGLEDFLVPKLILQPLIENSIKHGLVRAAQKGTVTVRTLRQGEQICITVQDNGAGMDSSQLAAYRQLLSNCSDGQKNIGIRNVARRLQLHFNGQCEFSVDSTPGAGTALRLLLPIITEG